MILNRPKKKKKIDNSNTTNPGRNDYFNKKS